MSLLSPAGLTLVRLMGEMPRGPRREGVFALWLTLRMAEDLIVHPAPPERTLKKRVLALEQRLSSLTIPAPLRRALVSALSAFQEPGRERVGQVLQLLVAPAREVLGTEAAEAISRAGRSAAQRIRDDA